LGVQIYPCISVDQLVLPELAQILHIIVAMNDFVDEPLGLGGISLRQLLLCSLFVFHTSSVGYLRGPSKNAIYIILTSYPEGGGVAALFCVPIKMLNGFFLLFCFAPSV
jgi:hypothetical protein